MINSGNSFPSYFGSNNNQPFSPFNVEQATAIENVSNSSNSSNTSSGYTVSPGGDPRKTQGQITRNEFKLFNEQFKPLEQRALKSLKDDKFVEKIADKAGAVANESIDSSAGIEDRQLSRFGQSQSNEEQKVSDTREGLDRALSVTNAKNSARQEARGIRTALSSDALQIGKGVAGQASSDIGSAAGIAESREQRNEAASAQRKQNTMNTVMGIAGIAASFI